MKSILKIAAVSVVVTVGTTLLAMAQIDTGIEFTTSVPFYAGNADMPAASYKITQPDLNADMLLIRSTDETTPHTRALFPRFPNSRTRSPT
jgi:hypothetical protein